MPFVGFGGCEWGMLYAGDRAVAVVEGAIRHVSLHDKGTCMDQATVHIHLFKVGNTTANGRSLEAMIDAIELDPLQDRIRTVGATGVRLDVIEKLSADGKTPRLWLLDFTRLRDTHGPGKAKRNTLVEDLDIAADEFFGEESAALYVPDHGCLLVQYNHFGVRPKAMETFFSEYLEGEVNVYEFNVVLDADAEQRFKNQKYLKRFEIGVDVTQLSADDRKNGNALGAMADAAAELDATRMKIVISVGHDRERNLKGAKKLLRWLQGNGSVISAVVAGRETPDGQVEVVDLINEKLVCSENIKPGEGRRLAVEDRFKALRRAYGKWAARIKNG